MCTDVFLNEIIYIYSALKGTERALLISFFTRSEVSVRQLSVIQSVGVSRNKSIISPSTSDQVSWRHRFHLHHLADPKSPVFQSNMKSASSSLFETDQPTIPRLGHPRFLHMLKKPRVVPAGDLIICAYLLRPIPRLNHPNLGHPQISAHFSQSAMTLISNIQISAPRNPWTSSANSGLLSFLP
ncbi:uncharacterized protein LOC105423216 [Pogonomyrmex barbatus]|uniref:Uncharacterized protein LOC105423216 n=1 Tax=Pogonomyrmex barbatus TaxID=144034 RepID=A0A6I9VTH6_9HYME|nr:uncharacterized protein LOC105423216 [Pogonomyrmex barbatus]